MPAIEDVHTERSGNKGPSWVRILELEAQLTAAEEQVAGLMEAATSLLDALERFDRLIDYKRDDALIACMGAQEQLKQALSAAPKRGRVIWKGEADVMESQEDKEPVIYIGASSTFEVNAFALWIYGRPKELKGGQDVTVTVREAE